ncbi:MAG: zf-HC2 domain-containing protein [Chloroflexi bacterium]|nr:zf-HC2 domain-containing protein [Chloroflexota bacterium]
MNNDELTCQELVELISDYLESALAPTERVRFEQHLTTCAGCRAYLEQMRRMIRTLGAITEKEISEDTLEQLLQTFRDWKHEKGGEHGR